jgi:hypothetical protein
VAGCCECGDEPSGSCATELVSYVYATVLCHLYEVALQEILEFVAVRFSVFGLFYTLWLIQLSLKA